MTKIICFGDTITEMGLSLESRGYVARLAERYARRADVLCRGFSGYTTREALDILHSAVLSEHPDIVILFFGVNDSVLPDQVTHVPPEEYKAHLQEMASRIAWAGAWLIMINAPPLDEVKTLSRQMEHTSQYAQICHEVGLEMQVPVIDLFHLIQEEPNWQERCMLDGIHLTRVGMDILYEALIERLDKIKPLQKLPRLSVNGI